ncbi:MAG: hypothetical protein KA957_03470, partial [Syntrophaceae bacterium]|nr:hypothetical protein [Syntrophaceae bacterium]
MTATSIALYSTFFQPGEVVELRAMGLRGKNAAWSGFAGGKAGIVAGYFDDADKFQAAALALDRSGARGVYFTANPVHPALLARAANRLTCPSDGEITNDLHTACLRWFLVDLDAPMLDGARRPKGISASNEEMQLCMARAEEVARYLEGEHGFARALRGMSGNGYHLNYRLPDLPNDDEHRFLIRDAMAALAEKFGPVTIDVSVVNPSRIWKFYGTTARKGDSTADRPHRVAYLYPNQPAVLDDIPSTDIETFRKFASRTAAAESATHADGSARQDQPPPAQASQPPAPSPVAKTTRMKPNELGPLDMEKYLSHFGVKHSVKEITHSKYGPATAYVLNQCLFNADHTDGEAAIIVPHNGAFKYQCFHASCKGKTWKDAKSTISGGKNLAEFCRGYDPAWTPPKDTGTGMMAALPTPMTNATALQ